MAAFDLRKFHSEPPVAIVLGTIVDTFYLTGSNRVPKSDREFPFLTTERLRLRVPDMDDAEAFRALLSIPEVTRYSNWPDAPNKTFGERALRRMSKLHADRSGCAWIIEEGASKG